MTTTARRRYPGPVYDHSMHYLVEGDLAAWCDWLDAKVDGEADLLSPDFAAESRRADLLVRVGRGRLLHAEYIRQPKTNMFARMVDYRAKIMRRYQGISLTQFAIVLEEGRLREFDDAQNGFFLGLRTIHLPEVDPDEFLKRPSLAALAELARGDQHTRPQSVINAIRVIRTLPPERQPGIFEAMINLATISLDGPTIDLIRRESGMSVNTAADFYGDTEIGRELLDRGRKQGHELGHLEGSAETVMIMLRARLGDDPRIPAVAWRIVQSPEMNAHILAINSVNALDRLPPELLTDS